MSGLLHWSLQQQHLLQQLQALGAQEMQLAQAFGEGHCFQRYRVPGNCMPLRWQATERSVEPDKLEVVASFDHLGDILSAASGCELSTTTHVKTAWKKFKELLPVLSSRHLSFRTCGCMYSSCVWRAMLHVSETWPLTKPDLQSL